MVQSVCHLACMGNGQADAFADGEDSLGVVLPRNLERPRVALLVGVGLLSVILVKVLQRVAHRFQVRDLLLKLGEPLLELLPLLVCHVPDREVDRTKEVPKRTRKLHRINKAIRVRLALIKRPLSLLANGCVPLIDISGGTVLGDVHRKLIDTKHHPTCARPPEPGATGLPRRNNQEGNGTPAGRVETGGLPVTEEHDGWSSSIFHSRASLTTVNPPWTSPSTIQLPPRFIVRFCAGTVGTATAPEAQYPRERTDRQIAPASDISTPISSTMQFSTLSTQQVDERLRGPNDRVSVGNGIMVPP